MKRMIALFLLICCFFSAGAYAEQQPNITISSPSAILIEAESGQVLFEQNSHDRRPPASVTKIMTMLLVMEAIDRGQIAMEDMVTCSDYAASMGGSQVYLEPGEQMSVHDMLKAVAVASGNDAAVALGEHIAGSSEAFVDMMNKRAGELGMNDTNFVNCNGLDHEAHLTSAHDIALMSRELTSHSAIFDFTSIWMDSLRDGAFGLVNTNKLIRFYEGANGLKTGSTGAAKYCLSASACRDGMTLIAVVMGAESSKERFNDASRLLDFGFANYTIADSLLSDEELESVTIQKGVKQQIKPAPSEAFHLLVNKARIQEIEKKITLTKQVPAPIRAGDKLGEVEFAIDGQIIGTADLVATEDCPRLGPLSMLGVLAKQLLFGNPQAVVPKPIGV